MFDKKMQKVKIFLGYIKIFFLFYRIIKGTQEINK